MIIVLFLVQIIFSFLAVIAKILLNSDNVNSFDYYLFKIIGENDENVFIIFLRYFILLSSLIPISLIVNLEMVRLTQAYFTIENLDLKNKEVNRNCKVSTTTVNEELGQIEYVLTDKTGTLTQNKMILRGLMIGDKLFGGDFVLDSHGDKSFKVKSKDQFDQELDLYLRNQTDQKMPYAMDVAHFKVPIQKIGTTSAPKNSNLENSRVEGNDQINFMEQARLSFRKHSQIENSDDGAVQDNINLKKKVKRQESLIIDHHIEAQKQKLILRTNTLADLYPEEQYKYADVAKSSEYMEGMSHGMPNLKLPTYPIHLTSSQDRHGPLETNPLKFTKKGREVDLDAERQNQIKFMDDIEKNDEVLQQNKFFFDLPAKDRVYPKCNYQNGTVFETYTELAHEFMACAALCHELLVEEKKEADGNISKSYQGSSPEEIAICLGAKQCGIEFMGNKLGSSKVDFLGEIQDWEVLIVSYF